MRRDRSPEKRLRIGAGLNDDAGTFIADPHRIIQPGRKCG